MFVFVEDVNSRLHPSLLCYGRRYSYLCCCGVDEIDDAFHFSTVTPPNILTGVGRLAHISQK
jgi:hypothetical protein